MVLVIVLVVLVIASVLFHFMSPWYPVSYTHLTLPTKA